MTTDELRNNFSDAFIALVMDEAGGSTMDLSSEDQREAIVLALQDAIEFFSTPEFALAAATLADCWRMRMDTRAS